MILEKNETNHKNDLLDKLGAGDCYSELPEDMKKICHERKATLTEKEKSVPHKLISGAVINMFEKKFKDKKAA